MDDLTIAVDGLVLRPPSEADISDIVEACSDPLTQRWLPGLPAPYTAQNAHLFVTTIAPGLADKGGRTWSVLDAGTERLLGNVGLPRVEKTSGVAEVGYWVAPWARGQRVATRAAKAATRWAFEHGMGRVELMTDPANVRSQRVAIAAGFVRESVRVGADILRDGTRGDLICWRRLAGDPEGPSVRAFPDPPAEGLSDGVVTLRTPIIEDAQALLECRQDNETRRWLSQPKELTLDAVRRTVELAEADLLGGVAAHFTVVEVATGAACGDCTVGLAFPLLGSGNLGYMIHPAFRGRGYATRAARLAADWALSLPSIGRLEAGAVVKNEASLRVIAKAGFTYEGVLHGFLPNPAGPRWDVGVSSRTQGPLTSA
jgi:RimJ/RimL family protein N-acetyltransferase